MHSRLALAALVQRRPSLRDVDSTRLPARLVPSRERRLSRDLPVILTVAIIVAALGNALTNIPPLLSQGFVGGDFRIYHDAAARWMQTGDFYLPHQVAGAYSITPGDVLYPPTILYLLVPFLVLPAILWWVIPLTTLAVAIAKLRPARWAWPIIALAIWWPRDQGLVVLGNPGMWIGAAIAAGVVLGWPAAFVALKPSFLPLALIGVRTRGWWRTAGLMAVGSVGLVGSWVQYATILRNSDLTIGYSLLELPFMLVPIIAWLARTERAPVTSQAAVRERGPIMHPQVLAPEAQGSLVRA